MRAAASTGSRRREPRPGTKLSATLQRWPARNYFAELDPPPNEVHPIDALMDSDPSVRRIGRRARRLLARIQRQAKLNDVLDFEAERNLLDSTRVEAAFNLGFENGLVLGRVEGLRRNATHPPDREVRVLQHEMRAALARTTLAPQRVGALLLDLARAFVLDADSSRPRS